MIIRLKKHHLSYFKAKAKGCPNEIYAALLGKRISPHIIEVEKFFYPKLTVSKPGELFVDKKSFNQICFIAKEKGLKLIADLHSHPEYIPILSYRDFQDLKEGTCVISGIVGILGKKVFVNFWEKGSSLPCRIEYINVKR